MFSAVVVLLNLQAKTKLSMTAELYTRTDRDKKTLLNHICEVRAVILLYFLLLSLLFVRHTMGFSFNRAHATVFVCAVSREPRILSSEAYLRMLLPMRCARRGVKVLVFRGHVKVCG